MTGPATCGIAIAFVLMVAQMPNSMAFQSAVSRLERRSTTGILAKPKRFEENVDGPLYVNDKCINCAACSHFAPTVFGRSSRDNGHIVFHQPSTEEEILQARASLAACPVAAIRVETNADRHHRGLDPQSPEERQLAPKLAINPKFNGLEHPFPRPVSPAAAPDVYFVGHHNDASFGATPYLVSTSSKSTETQWIMVDTPRFSKSAVEAVEKVTGPAGPHYLFLTHVDDTADHHKWKEHYPKLKRIFNSGDLGRHNWIGDKKLEDVEILLRPHDDSENGLNAYLLDGTPVDASALDSIKDDVVLLHTPGHSPGSTTLWKRPTGESCGVIFTGDTYGYTTREGGHMTAFPRFGNNLHIQRQTISSLVNLNDSASERSAWSIVAPGHGHVRDYTDNSTDKSIKTDLEDAVKELERYTAHRMK